MKEQERDVRNFMKEFDSAQIDEQRQEATWMESQVEDMEDHLEEELSTLEKTGENRN